MLLVIVLIVLSGTFFIGYIVGRGSRPPVCQGCDHPPHGNVTCLKQVPCALGIVGCTCQGMELQRKQLTLPAKKD
jgi:hypothetical protein